MERNSVFLVACISIGVSCTDIEEKPKNERQSEDLQPEQVAWGWESVVTKSGVRRAVLRAARYRNYGASRVDSLDQGVEVSFFDHSGEQASVLRSTKGAFKHLDRSMEALGGVVITASDSTILKTQSLRWDNNKDRIYGDGAVTIQNPEGIETGIGFESTPDLKKWSMRNVTTKKKR